MPKAIPFYRSSTTSRWAISPTSTASSARIADLETRKRAVAGELIRRDVSEAEGALFRSLVVAETIVSTLDRSGIEKETGEAWIACFLKFSKRSAFVKTMARTGAVQMAA